MGTNAIAECFVECVASLGCELVRESFVRVKSLVNSHPRQDRRSVNGILQRAR